MIWKGIGWTLIKGKWYKHEKTPIPYFLIHPFGCFEKLRGFKYMFLQEAERVFKKKNDPRLKLGTTVKSIAYDKKGVTITTDKDTIIADYAISTFS